VAKSQEVSTWFVMAGATLVLIAFSGGMGSGLTANLRGLIANSYQIPMSGPTPPRLFDKLGRELLATLAIPFLLLPLAALGGNLIQHRLVWSVEVLAPMVSKLSLAAGFKRLFSTQGFANLAKGLTKFTLIGAVLPLVKTMALEGTAVALMAIVAAAN
jgi:flagellar biosynthetic protein FlhB